jgi:hypothetical protein
MALAQTLDSRPRSSSDADARMMRSHSEGQLLPAHVVARLAWSHANREKVEREKREQEHHRRVLEQRARALHAAVQSNRAATYGLDRAAVASVRVRNRAVVEQEHQKRQMDDMARAAAKQALCERVRRRREEAFGRVEASRNAVLEKNRKTRMEEGIRQQFALDEKARRLALLREEHQRMLAAKYVEVPTADFMDDSFRLLATSGRPSSARSLSRSSSAGAFGSAQSMGLLRSPMTSRSPMSREYRW